jgi:hypothetical protein
VRDVGAVNLSTARLGDADNGVGSALVNTTQQVGGSVGIALLSTLAASAARSYLHSHARLGAAATAYATLHSYSVAYWVAAGIFGVGALGVGALYRPGRHDAAVTGNRPPIRAGGRHQSATPAATSSLTTTEELHRPSAAGPEGPAAQLCSNQ